MFRIITNQLYGRLEFVVDGTLSADCIPALEQCCRQALEAGKRVFVLLRDVPAVDLNGQDLISRLQKLGVTVRGSDLYTSYVVDLCKKDALKPKRRLRQMP